MMMLDVNGVASVLGVKNAKAYQIIRQLNQELEKEGYLIVTGKISEEYLKERFRLEEEHDDGKNN